MSQHATCSPSSAHRWLACPASVWMQQGLPDEDSAFAAEGTAAHEAAALALTCGLPVQPTGALDADACAAIQNYVDYVEALSHGHTLRIEHPLDISLVTGEPGAQGTADALVITDDELIVMDLKFGRGVQVSAEHNEQLSIYALAALFELPFHTLRRIKSVRLVIVQPRLGHVSEWVCTPAELKAWSVQVRTQARRVFEILKADQPQESDFGPAQSACRFCRAKATCPALARKVQDAVGADFEDLTGQDAADAQAALQNLTPATPQQLARAMAATDLIEAWCKAVRAEIERLLLAGVPGPGYKLVQGRKSARAWGCADEVEALMKAMRLPPEQMYERSLISPASAEKLHKAGAIGPRQWPKLAAHITQREGRPSVAPEADKRPALPLADAASDFANETGSTA